MRNLMLTLARVTGVLANIALWLAGTGLVMMTAIIAAQVFWRYVLNNSIVWSEPGSVMVMGWFIFLGAAVGIKEGYHLSFDVVLYFLPELAKKFFHTLSDIATAAFGFGMIWYGMRLLLKTMPNKMPSLGISDAYNFAPIVAGGVLVVLFSLERLFRRAAGLPTPRFGDDPAADAAEAGGAA